MAYGSTSNKPEPTAAEAETLARQLLPRAQRGLQACWISYTALLLVFAINNATDEQGSLRFFLVQTVPLLIFIPGMLKQHHKTFSLLCFAILLYFTAYVAEVGAPSRTVSDTLALTLTVILFISAMLTSRWLQRGRYYQWLATRNRQQTDNSET